jgi:AhpD family alkylhydroperoxidase
MPQIAYAQEGHEAQGATPYYNAMKQGLGVVPNVMKLVGHSGPATETMGTMLDAYFNKLSIDAKLREIAYLTVAKYNGCGYCQGHHVPAGKQAGLSDGQIEQLNESGFNSSDFTSAEQAVIRFAYETTRDVAASQEALDALKKHYDEQAIAEIAFVVATGNFIQRIGKNLGAELEG